MLRGLSSENSGLVVVVLVVGGVGGEARGTHGSEGLVAGRLLVPRHHRVRQLRLVQYHPAHLVPADVLLLHLRAADAEEVLHVPRYWVAETQDAVQLGVSMISLIAAAADQAVVDVHAGQDDLLAERLHVHTVMHQLAPALLLHQLVPMLRVVLPRRAQAVDAHPKPHYRIREVSPRLRRRPHRLFGVRSGRFPVGAFSGGVIHASLPDARLPSLSLIHI